MLLVQSGGPAALSARNSGSERSVLREIVLLRLHGARAGERGADEAQADGVELAGWKLGGRIAGPEAVEVARDDGEARHL
jgi:hypothetical protein